MYKGNMEVPVCKKSNRKYFLMLMLCIIIFFSFFISLNTQTKDKEQTQLNMKIKMENQPRIVNNPEKPIYGDFVFNLEEDLVLGYREEDRNYDFFKAIRITIDNEGNIFVLDHGNNRIQKFGKKGQFIQTIGKKGQGPGEFIQPRGIFLDAKDNLYICDVYRIHIFENSGKFKDIIKMSHYSSKFGITNSGNILMKIAPYSQKDRIENLILINPDGEEINEIARFSFQSSPIIKGHQPYNPFAHRLYFYFTSNGLGVFGSSSEYRLYIIENGEEVSIISEKDEAKEPITKKEKDGLIDHYMATQKKMSFGQRLTVSDVKKAFVFPQFKPFFSKILIDEQNRIYVKRFKSPLVEEDGECFDLFSKSGQYLYRITMPVDPLIIKSGYLYKSTMDSDTGYKKVLRYKINNYNDIKSNVNSR